MGKDEKKFTRDKESKIEEIIETMVEIVREKGLHQASVRDIPGRTDVSIGTVYRYFPKGKVDIFFEIMRRNVRKILDLDIPDDLDYAGFMRVWSRIIALAIETRRSGLFVTELTNPPASDTLGVLQEITKLASGFYNDLARRFRKIDRLSGCSEAEIFRKIVMLQHIMDRVINTHLNFPLFADDEELTNYLLRLVEMTFETCTLSQREGKE